MAFPVVAGTQQNATTVNSTSVTITYPSSIAADDMLIFGMATDGGGAATTGHPAGWTLMTTTVNGTASRGEFYWKRATGSESGTFVLTTPSEMTSYRMLRITGAHTTSAPEFNATATTGNTVNPNSPAVTPSWGAEDTLWIAAFAIDYATAITMTSHPTNYTDNQFFVGGVNAGGAAFGHATRNLNGTTDDPGNWVISAAEQWVAQLIAVRTAPPAAGQILRRNPVTQLLAH